VLVPHKNSDYLEGVVSPSQRPSSLVSLVGTELYQFPVNKTKTVSGAKHVKLNVKYTIIDYLVLSSTK
jgi:hypothetical protein